MLATVDTIYYCYILIDPRDNKIRYVGITKNIKRRLTEHQSRSRYAFRPTHKNNWIRELLSLELTPRMEIIWETNSKELIENVEEYYIWYYSQFYKLTNLTQRLSTKKHTEEEKQKLRDIYKPIILTEAAQKRRNEKISIAVKERYKDRTKTPMYGKRMSESAKAKLVLSLKEYYKTHEGTLTGKHHSNETKSKISKAHLGKQYWLGKHHLQITKEKIRKANLVFKHTEEQYQRMITNKPKGENCKWAYLTESIVMYIRKMKKMEARPCFILKTFKSGTISQSAFEHIWYNRSWKHLEAV